MQLPPHHQRSAICPDVVIVCANQSNRRVDDEAAYEVAAISGNLNRSSVLGRRQDLCQPLAVALFMGAVQIIKIPLTPSIVATCTVQVIRNRVAFCDDNLGDNSGYRFDV